MYCKLQALPKNGKLHAQTLLRINFGPVHVRAAAARWTCVAPCARTKTSSARAVLILRCTPFQRADGQEVSIIVPREGYIP
jgi:hypothetical protein